MHCLDLKIWLIPIGTSKIKMSLYIASANFICKFQIMKMNVYHFGCKIVPFAMLIIYRIACFTQIMEISDVLIS